MTAPAKTNTATATVEAKAVHTLVQWRHADKDALANNDSRAARAAEYKARRKLRDAADAVDQKGGQS